MPCHPRDLLDQVTALCRYLGKEPAITRGMLDAACDAYFINEAPIATQSQAQRGAARKRRLNVH